MSAVLTAHMGNRDTNDGLRTRIPQQARLNVVHMELMDSAARSRQHLRPLRGHLHSARSSIMPRAQPCMRPIHS